MRNAGMEKAQAEIKIARRNINNLRYADDTILITENEEELKRFLMKMKEESEKVGLKLNIEKTNIMASGPIISWEIDGETVETVSDLFYHPCLWTVKFSCLIFFFSFLSIPLRWESLATMVLSCLFAFFLSPS